MTLELIATPTEHQVVGSTSELPCHRWPAHMAKNMADSIHEQVMDTLSQSRLVCKPHGIQLVRREDIICVEKILGTGAFSQVSSVIASDGLRYACKHLMPKLMDEPDSFRLAAAELACEAHMLASFDHPNILKVRGWARNGVASFEEGCADSFFLLLDLLEETLDHRIDRWVAEERHAALIEQESLTHAANPSALAQFWRRLRHPSSSCPSARMPESQQEHAMTLNYKNVYTEKLQIMTDIASALEYIHERGVIFRDLKPNNIGFLGNRRVQLFDFGLSRELPSLDTSVPFEMSGKVGTLRYMAPEVALHQPYNIAADVYSWAMVSYELLGLQKPFHNWTRAMHSEWVCKRGVRPDTSSKTVLHPIPLDMCVILDQAWNSHPARRPTVSQISSQLQFLMRRHLLLLGEQQLQIQLSQQLEVERQTQHVAAAVLLSATASTAVYMDMSYALAPSAPQKLRRSRSIDSLETIDTSVLSGDSIEF